MTVHVFDVDDAIKYGMEKAVILQNMRFWLEKNKANGNNLHDGYYWTYNTVEAFYELFPYFKSQGVIQRLLKSMEKEGLLLVGNYNKKAYDRTKWYSMPEYSVESIENSHLLKMTNGVVKNDECNHQKSIMDLSDLANGFVKNDEPIPDINTDIKPDVNTDKKSKPKFDALTYPIPSFIKQENWNDFVAMRKEIKKPLTETAAKRLISKLTEFDANGFDANESLDYSIMGQYQGVFERNRKQQSNNQVNGNERHNTANNSNQPKQSSADAYAAKYAEQRRQRDEAANTAATGCDRGYVYDMEAPI